MIEIFSTLSKNRISMRGSNYNIVAMVTPEMNF